MLFNYEMLKKEISKFGEELFIKKMGISKKTIDSRLKGVSQFTMNEIDKIVNILNLNPIKIPAYFFKTN